MTETTISRSHAGGAQDAPPLAFVRLLDPLRSVRGVLARYDCPDLAALDRHIAALGRRIAAARSPAAVDAARVDVDRLLDRRTWLTLLTRSVGDTTVRRRPE